DKGHANYPISGDRTVTPIKKPDASKYVSRAIFSGKRAMDAAQVAKRIAAIKAAVAESQPTPPEEAARVTKKAPARADQ
ncbi:MAG: hypothetical protein WAK03_07940, partial [Methylocystis sp.]